MLLKNECVVITNCANQTIQKGAAVLAAPFVNSRKESSTISISNINGMILNIFQVDKLLGIIDKLLMHY